MKKFLSIVVVVFLLLSSIAGFAEDSTNLNRISVVPGVHTFVDWSISFGEVALYNNDSSIYGYASYKILSDNYILFNFNDSKSIPLNGIYSASSSGSYWKDEVVRTYPEETYVTSINYSEMGPYGYASGTLHWYAAGLNIHNPGYVDIWYQGTLYYGDYIPTMVSNDI